MEPSSSESEDDLDQDVPPSPFSDEADPIIHERLSEPRPILQGIHYLIFYSFIVSTILDGLVHFFFPLLTTSDNTLFPTVFRSTGIYSLTLSILSAGVIRSLNGHIDLVSIFLVAAWFHCTASLGNLIFSLSSHGIRAIDVYEWLSMVFYVSFLIVLVRSQGKYLVNRVLVTTGLRT